jgi:fucose 4-O-acetylase-like acetyltransferase
MVTHFYSSMYNGYDDGMVVHEFVVAVFVFSMGHQSAGRGFTIGKAALPVVVYCAADFIWYWLKECGKWGDFDALRPFMMNSTHFFSPLVNYSPGGYLWFLQCFVILKVTHEVFQRLLPDKVLLRLVLAHVLWVIGAFVTKWNFEYLNSLPGQHQALIYHTLLMPTIPMFAMGTVTSKEFVNGLQNFRIRCVLAVVGTLILALWAFLPTMDYMKLHWSSPTYVALVGYPMMLLQVLILISLVPHRPTAFSGLGERSLLLYILHPLFFELVRNVYQDLLRKPYPWENLTWIDHQYDFIQLMIAWFSCLGLSLVLGSEMIWWSLGLSKSKTK